MSESARKQTIIESLKDGLIVSCQAVPSEPHYLPGIATMFARCAQWAGARGVRVNSPDDIRAVKAAIRLPVVGIWKIDRNVKDVYLTPSLDAARAVWDAGAEIIAMQATDHRREDGKRAYRTIEDVRGAIPEALIFADVATADDARIAAQCGADFVAPTLYGYTRAGAFDTLDIKDSPDFYLLRDIVDAVQGTTTKVIMEGKVATPEIAVQCLYMGAHAVVVGNAITRPHITAKRFARMLDRFHEQ